MSEKLLNDMFTSQYLFVNMLPNLLSAKSLDGFKIWFQKLDKTDRRSLVMFVRKNGKDLPKEYYNYAKKFFEVRDIKI